MNRKTCHECQRLRWELDEVVHKRFRLEEGLRHAKLRQDDDQVRALEVLLGYLADERVRLNSVLIEHEAQGHPQAGRGHTG